MNYFTGKYPFGLHGYHRPQGKTGKVSPVDPLNATGSTYDPSYKGRQEEEKAAQEEAARRAALRSRIDKMYGAVAGDDADTVAGRTALETERTKLSDATRGYYADQLGDDYSEAERKTRFNLARQGLLGSSEEVSRQADLKKDRDLGATRIDEAVARAVAQLTTQREQERLKSINLVNAGEGEQAVNAAQAGIRSSYDSVANQQKAELFDDLFAGAVEAGNSAQAANQEALLASRYRQRLGSFFPSNNASTGRVTSSS
jgi:hypothetical protein